jgi:hypothetical protein
MRTKRLLTGGAALSGVLALLLSACQDPGLGPEQPQPEQPQDAEYRPNALLGGLLGGSSDTTVTGFTVSPTQSGSYKIAGGHSIYFPAGAICDPRSSYGVTEWNKPCTPATTAITITAKSYTQANGRPRVDFSPRLRFVPTKTVTLAMLDLGSVLDLSSQILWCPDGSTTCVNEAQTDSTLTTLLNKITGILSRRIKHFSGYAVSGRTTAR